MKLLLDPVLPKKGDFKMLSILPMNHLFEMTVGFSTFLNLGVSVYYTQSLKPKDVLSIIRDKKINGMVLVPAFLKLLKTTLESEIKNSSKFYQKTFPIKYHIAKFIPYRWAKKLMFKKLHNCFGGTFKWCIIGGAPLDVDVAKFFRRIGIEVYQGYGLTETSPVATMSFDSNRDIRSVGKLLPSYEGRVDSETGELLLKGPSIMRGYHHQPELTAEAIDQDGWFHTGDIAKIDDNGQVYITGRIKNMIVLSGGKKVFPEEVEAVLETSELFAETCVFGMEREGGAKDGTEDIMAVVVPKDDLISQYGEKELDKIMKDEVKRLSQQLTPYKRPINISVLKTPLPRTKKATVQRNKVKELIKNLK
jgi:long-chain acyl-CoA synthetase